MVMYGGGPGPQLQKHITTVLQNLGKKAHIWQESWYLSQLTQSEGRRHPAQVTSLSQGYTETTKHTHFQTYTSTQKDLWPRFDPLQVWEKNKYMSVMLL